MGIILAKREEERLDFNHRRARAAEYLARCKPDYLDDDRLLRLSPEDPEEESDEEEEEDDEEKNADPDEEKDDDEDDVSVNPEEQLSEAQKAAKKRVAAELKKFRIAAMQGNRWRLLKMTRSPHLAIDSPDKHGRTALYHAAERGQLKAVEHLLASHARHDVANKMGWTPLHAAAFHGQVACIHQLVTNQANVNAQDNKGCTPLIFAASSPKLHLVDLVDRADRKKRIKAREDVLKRMKEKEGISADALAEKGKQMTHAHTPPNLIYKFYPQRIEVMTLDALLSSAKTKVDQFDSMRRTALLYASKYGRTFAVSRLLDAKANMAFADRAGETPLFAAACNEHIETTDLLLRFGAMVNTTDQYFRTPLHGALENSDESMVNMLLKAEASVNAYDCEGRTPIMMAMDASNRRLFSKIVDKKSNLDVLDKRGWNVVIYAIETGMLTDVYPLLLKLNKTSGNAQIIMRARDPQGANAMHHAVQLDDMNNSTKYVNLLNAIDFEAATIGDCNGDTAIHNAAERGRLQILRVFMDKLQQVDFLNNRGETPLHYAARGGHMACVVALLHDTRKKEASCDGGAVDGQGWNLLMHSCVSGHLDLVNLILQNREGQHPEIAFAPLDVNQTDAAGVNALSIAAREGHWQLLPSLMLAGANIAAKDKDGFTAVHWAAIEDEPLTMKCLLDLGLDPSSQDSKGWSPLMHACARGADEVVRVLVDWGAQIDARNWDGDTALQIAARRPDPPECIEATKDILLDGVMTTDEPRRGGSVSAVGALMVSVLEAHDLYLEGKIGFVNTYVNILLRTQSAARPQAAFTSCVLSNSSPEWHEVFRFDTTRFDKDAVMVAWVIAAPGEDAKEVIDGAHLGLTEQELRNLSHMEAMTGKTLHENHSHFTTAMQDSLSRLTKRADRVEDKEVLRLRKLAMAQLTNTEPTEDLKYSAAEMKNDGIGMPLADRRWNEVSNLRQVLARSGCDVPAPIVPRTHLPMGCVVVRYRHLRAAVWGSEPVTVTRTLRLSCRGSLRVQIDFRPQFFRCKEDAGDQVRSAEEDQELFQAMQPQDDETEYREALLAERLESKSTSFSQIVFDIAEKKAAHLSAEEALERANQKKHLEDPVSLVKRFRKVTNWANNVIKIRNTYQREQLREARRVKKQNKLNVQKTAVQGKTKKSIDKAPFYEAPFIYAKRKYEEYKNEKAHHMAMLEKPIGTPDPREVEEQTQQLMPNATPLAAPRKIPVPVIPKLKTERWVEEFLDGSRFS